MTSAFIVFIKLMMFPQVGTNAFAMVHDGLIIQQYVDSANISVV